METGCFLVNLPGKQRGARWRGAHAARGRGGGRGECQRESERKGQGPGPGRGSETEGRTVQGSFVTLSLHLINQPFWKHNLYSSGLPHTASQHTFYRSRGLGFWDLQIPASYPFPFSPMLAAYGFTSTPVPTSGGWFGTSECSVFRTEKPVSQRTCILGLCPTHIFFLEHISFLQNYVFFFFFFWFTYDFRNHWISPVTCKRREAGVSDSHRPCRDRPGENWKTDSSPKKSSSPCALGEMELRWPDMI